MTKKTKDYRRAVEAAVKRIIHAADRPRFRSTDRPVRCSSPPICEIATAFVLVRRGGARTDSFLMDFYTNVGTVSHQVFQRWAGRLGLLYGQWECPACRVRRQGRGPMLCPKCKREMLYRELEVTVTGDLKGSTDGLIPVDRNTYVVMDLKFVGPSTLKRVAEAPAPIHYHQCNLYAYGLQKQYKDLKIAGVAIIYISRANPRQFKVHFFPGVDRKVVQNAKRILRRVKYILTRRPQKLAELRPLCSEPEDAPFCPFQQLCFEAPNGMTPHAYLKTLLAHSDLVKSS